MEMRHSKNDAACASCDTQARKRKQHGFDETVLH